MGLHWLLFRLLLLPPSFALLHTHMYFCLLGVVCVCLCVSVCVCVCVCILIDMLLYVGSTKAKLQVHSGFQLNTFK